GDLLDHIRGHRRERGLCALDDFCERHAHRLATRVVEDEHLAFFAQTESREDLTGIGFDRDHAEGHIDIATWIKRIFKQSIEAAVTNAIERGAKRLSHVADFMAVRTYTFRKNRTPHFRIELTRKEDRTPLRDQLGDAIIFRRKAGREFRNLLIDIS